MAPLSMNEPKQYRPSTKFTPNPRAAPASPGHGDAYVAPGYAYQAPDSGFQVPGYAPETRDLPTKTSFSSTTITTSRGSRYMDRPDSPSYLCMSFVEGLTTARTDSMTDASTICLVAYVGRTHEQAHTKSLISSATLESAQSMPYHYQFSQRIKKGLRLCHTSIWCISVWSWPWALRY